MAIAKNILLALLDEKFPDAKINLHDYGNDQDHYELTIIDQQFHGLSLVKRHQLIYKILGSIVGKDLHALSLKTLTPSESESRNHA